MLMGAEGRALFSPLPWFLLYPRSAFEQLCQGQTLALEDNLEEVPLLSSLVLEYLLQH